MILCSAVKLQLIHMISIKDIWVRIKHIKNKRRQGSCALSAFISCLTVVPVIPQPISLRLDTENKCTPDHSWNASALVLWMVPKGCFGGAYTEYNFSGTFPALTILCHVPAGIINA